MASVSTILKTNYFSKLPNQAKVFVWMVLLPLMLAGVAFWQMQVYSEQKINQDLVGNQTRIAELQDLRAKFTNYRYSGSIRVDGKEYRGYAAVGFIDKELMRLNGSNEVTKSALGRSIIRPAAFGAVVTGIMAALLGLYGLWSVKSAATTSMQSRDSLLTVFEVWRHRLPKYLTTIVLLMVLTILLLTIIESLNAYDVFFAHNATRGSAKLHMYTLVLCALTLWGGVVVVYKLSKSFEAFQSEPMMVSGRLVSQADSPKLWAHVQEIAKKLGATNPDNIVIGVDDGFYVTASDIDLLPSKQRITGQTLYLPLTYTALLRPQEVDAVIGHELGHFAGADTAYSQRFTPIYHGVVQNLQRLQEADQVFSFPTVAFGGYLFETFDHAVKHWSRQREFAADQAGASVVGAATAASALIRISAISPVIAAVLAKIARRPDEVRVNLSTALVEHVKTDGITPPDLSAQSATQHPTDTHPPTLERIKALGEADAARLMSQALSSIDDSGVRWLNNMLGESNSASLQASLLKDFQASSHQHNERLREHLTEVSSKVVDAVDIYEKRGTIFWICAVMSVVLLVISLFAVYRFIEQGATSAASRSANIGFIVLGLVVTTAVLGLGAWFFGKRSTKLLMRLTPTGLMSTSLASPLPWAEIKNYTFQQISNEQVHICFNLESSCPAPQLSGSNWRRIQYKKKDHALHVGCYGAKGMKSEAFYQMIGDYINADHARHLLKAM